MKISLIPLSALCFGVLAVAAVTSTGRGAEPDFSSFWHDGRAELDGYLWSVSRYGQRRSGECVMIYVTEPFSESKRVKVDDAARDPADTFDALKLNLIRDFQTGIYDYNTMTSVFCRSEDFAAVKISFSSAEWCGHVYEELRLDPRRGSGQLFSYFQGESSNITLDGKPAGISEDNLFILLRGLRGDYLRPGQTRSVPFLPGAFHRRLTHSPIRWRSAEIERLAELQTVEVPAGEFLTIVYVVRTDDGREGRFFIEDDYPHRIVRWTWEAGSSESRRGREASETGQLTGTARLKYWQLNDNGDERYLDRLGLRQATSPQSGPDVDE